MTALYSTCYLQCCRCFGRIADVRCCNSSERLAALIKTLLGQLRKTREIVNNASDCTSLSIQLIYTVGRVLVSRSLGHGFESTQDRANVVCIKNLAQSLKIHDRFGGSVGLTCNPTLCYTPIVDLSYQIIRP